MPAASLARKPLTMLQPTLAVGQPFVMPKPQQHIPEPAMVVGARSGRVYTMLGDNPNGPETMSVTPPPGPAPAGTPLTPGPNDIVLGRERSMLGGGTVPPETPPVSMAGGGSATIGDSGYYNEDWMNPSSYQNNPAYSQPQYGGGSSPSYSMLGGGSAPSFDNGYYQQLRQQQRQQQRQILDAQGGVIGARQATLPYQASAIGARQSVLPYQEAQIQARMATLPSQYAVLGATANTFGPRSAVTNANWSVLGAQNQSLAAQRGYIAQEQAANAARTADIGTVRAAQTNVADQNAVGEEALRRGVEDRNYSRLGVAAPVDVNTAPGAEGAVAPWARATLHTQADIATTRATQNEQDRTQQLQAAQLAVQLQDTNVTEAQNRARAAGLTLEEANQLVDQARNTAGYSQLGATAAGYAADEAGLGVSRATNALDLARLGETSASNYSDLAGLAERGTANDIANLQAPTDQGYELYTDPNTGQRQWLTPADADRRGLLQQRQTRLSVDQSVIPQEYQYNQAQTQYRNSQSPLAGYSPTDLQEMLLADPTYETNPAALNPLVDELVRRGYSQTQAQYLVGVWANQATDRRTQNEITLRNQQAAEGRRNGGSGTVFGTPPGNAPSTTPAPAAGGGSGFTFHP